MDADGAGEQVRALRARLAPLAAREQPAGLTEPDPDTPEERWDAGQVWAHLAEFVPYWHRQIEDVVGHFDGAPVPFGRTKTDAKRAEAIAIGRHRPIRALADDADRSLAALDEYLGKLDDQAWESRGLHPTRGVMGLEAMLQRFVIDHVDEHVAQLEKLAESV